MLPMFRTALVAAAPEGSARKASLHSNDRRCKLHRCVLGAC